ncbi:MAG: TonB-dependent receptor [Verrucomicrobia bacterium]|nr:TonB-dependent receptor [Verrucomicrobiota bacterium]
MSDHPTHRFPILCGLLLAASAGGLAGTPPPPPVQLPAYRVEAEAESDHYIQGPFLPDVQGAKINVGKKTLILDFDSQPRINGNNYRQALAQAPGLLLSEETSPLVSIGYRGLEPHRAQFTQVLKDGIPIHADQFGYPEAYYTPPLDTVDRIEFVRGGAALLYGPQPGGALNYVTHRPRTDRPFSGSTLHTAGTDGYYSTFSHLDGTVGRVGYYGYHNHRRSAGIRSANSDYSLSAWLGHIALDANSPSRWLLTVETYAEEHGEPGGLTFATGAGAVNYLTDRRAPSRRFDRFNLDRDAVSLIWERDYTHGTIAWRTWAIDYVRASRRQGGGGFGTLPTGAAALTNTIEHQRFTTWGTEARARYEWGSRFQHILSAGAQLYRSDSPRTDRRGAAPDAVSGAIQTESQREVFYAPVYVENLFRLGNLSLTPGFRLENVRQEVRELVNVARAAAGLPPAARDTSDTVPLLGLAAAWDLPAKAQFYANVSQSFRPVVFTQAVPNGATQVVNADLAEGRALQFEVGYRAQLGAGLVVDASAFQLEFDDQVGTLALPGGRSTVANVGRALHRGLEASVQQDLLRLVRPAGHTTLTAYVNALLLEAEFKEGAFAGRRPQYAPRHVVRAGLVLARSGTFKLGLTGTLADDSFGDDTNTDQRRVPAYAVWDLTAEWRVPRTPLRLIGGVNNVFDEDYYSRVRADGIDPAPRRNAYFGASFEF